MTTEEMERLAALLDELRGAVPEPEPKPPAEPTFAEMAEAAGLPSKPFYHVFEVEKATGIPKSAIYREIKAGRLQTTRYGKEGRRVLVRPAWVDAWISANTSFPPPLGASA